MLVIAAIKGPNVYNTCGKMHDHAAEIMHASIISGMANDQALQL